MTDWRTRMQAALRRLGDAVPAPVLRALGTVTPVGWWVAGAGAVSWILGWRLGWMEMMWAAAGCLVLLVVAVLFVFGRAILSVDVTLDPQRVVVGERSAGSISVRNIAGRRLLPLQVELAVGNAVATFDVGALPPGEASEELFVLPTTRRSVIPVGPASSVRSDPLGLLRRAVRWTEPVPLYVHPKTVTFDQIGAGFLRDLEGQPSNELSNSDVAFHALREYEPGDDRRHIHWRTYARVGELMVRQFVDSRRSHLAVVLSGHRPDYRSEEEFELGVSIGASLALRVLRDEQQVSIAACGQQLPAFSPTTMLDGFSGVEIGARGGDLVSQSTQLARTATGISLVALVTGSEQTLADVRAAAIRFPADVRVLAFRADLGGAPGFRPVGSFTAVNVGQLDELPKLLWAVGQA